ncbi:MAG: transporter substrate-binding domain-containing protein [Desulfovibrio sp.]|uniref:transporter substrate-binding domain-containing protein n=1 Tax=Desulfovibrio sp. 7SRBS1 TaxID=3378064 RepID=UPI003B409DE2
MRRNILICTVALVALLFTVSIASAKSLQQELVQESTIEQIFQRGTLKVGFSTFVPWAMKDKNGKFIGFEIDVATRLAKDMGVKIEFVPTKWSGIIPALLTGKFDVIIGGMGIRPDRNAKVNFTIPYNWTGMSIVANRAKAGAKNTIEAFNNPDVVISARLGTSAAKAAKKYMPKATLRLFEEETQAIQELLNGRADAMVASAPLPEKMAVLHAKKLYLPLKGTFTKEPNAFAIRKGDVDTLNYFDNWIRVVDSEGWLQERYHYWFETLDWEDQLK